MSDRPHCPTCAAFDRWVHTRSAGLSLPLADDPEEKIGFIYAHLPTHLTPEVVSAARSAACRAYRGAMLDDAAMRMTEMVVRLPKNKAPRRYGQAKRMLVEGALDELALHLLTAGASLPRA